MTMHEPPLRSLAPEDKRHAERQILLGRAADPAVLAHLLPSSRRFFKGTQETFR